VGATLPPHIKFEQAKHFMYSVLKGDPNTGSMLRGALKETIQSYLPQGKS
jgi:pyruvate dehydrogenase (quinone)